MPIDYKQQLETFYNKKSKLESKHLKTLHPKKSSKKKITETKLNESFQVIHQQIENPYTVEDLTLNRHHFINENELINNLKHKINELSSKVKEYELDILYELHESIEEYDQTVLELENIKKKYNEIIEKKKNRIKKESLVKEQKKGEIDRLVDSYKMAMDILDKREAYKAIQNKNKVFFEQYNRTDVIVEKQRARVDDENEKNKDETNVIVYRCVVNYSPIIDIEIKGV
jgi:hypothetical protein